MGLLSDRESKQCRGLLVRVGPVARVLLLPREPRQGIDQGEDREVAILLRDLDRIPGHVPARRRPERL